MPSLRSVRRLAALALLALLGCATVDPSPDYERAREEIGRATGESEVHDPNGPLFSAEEIQAALADGLGLSEATRLALLHNRRLQAGFLALGVARAEYVQAGLFENPSLSLAFLFPDPGGRVRWTADLMGSVAQIWQIPSRKALARAGIEQRILELSRFAGELVAATKEAYFESVAARGALSVARANTELALRSLDGVRRQSAQGVASKTDENLAEGLALEAQLAYQRAEREGASALRRLGALLSLERDLLDVPLTDPIPEPGLAGFEREALVELGRRSRPDLLAAQAAITAAEERVAQERGRRIPDIGVGLSAERPEGLGSSDPLIGPGATLEIPLFDQNQAQVSRAELELEERRREYEALVAEVGQEVRAASDKAEVAARAAVFARDELVPQAERSATLAEKAYELGDTTILALIQVQKAALAARRTAIDALLEAALSRIEVERTTGIPLSASFGAEKSP